MRVLFTCLPATGHFHPLVPIARAVADTGHEVAFATHASLASLVERAGFTHLPAGRDLASPEVGAVLAEMGTLPQREQPIFAARRFFGELMAPVMADDLLRLLEQWPADLLVRDSTEIAGCVVAERLGLPHAAVSVVAVGIYPAVLDAVAEPANALRTAHGLPPDPSPAMLDRYLNLHPFPPSFLDPSLQDVATTRFIRPEPFDRSGDEALPDWVDDLPDQPTVYATLGTAFNIRTDLFAGILAGLRNESVNLILTVGRDQDPAQFGAQPPNVRIERYIPASLLLPRCDLVLTHGGSGTTMAALVNGLPLVITPISADQPDNAERCTALGVGRVVEADQFSPAAVRDAVSKVLAEPSYRRTAEQVRDEIRALPGSEHAARLLEQLVAEHGRIGATA
jgi:UDP:flavonoid glycosyltransferase YjiC (YdhE family)